MQSVTVALLLCCACAASAAPCGGDGKHANHGDVKVDFSQTHGVGTAVHIKGQSDLHRFDDGSALHAHGNYHQVLQGPAKGGREFGAGVNLDGQHGDVGVGVQHQPGFGSTLGVQGQGELWRSRDGGVRVTAEGHYDRVMNGPARGQHDLGGSVQLKANLP